MKLTFSRSQTTKKRLANIGSLGLTSDSYPNFNSCLDVDFDATNILDENYDYQQTGVFKNDNCLCKNRVSKKKNQVFFEGYVEKNDNDELGRTKSLTDEDLEELKGCLDLGFGFSYEEILELCNTLPALELCYSLSQKFLDDQQQQHHHHHHKSPAPESSLYPLPLPESPSPPSGPIANWKISSRGEFTINIYCSLFVVFVKLAVF